MLPSSTSIILFLVSTLVFVLKDRNSIEKLISLVNNKNFFISVSILTGLLVYSYHTDKSHNKEKFYNALNEAFQGFLIALFAYLDYVVAPFIFIFILSFSF